MPLLKLSCANCSAPLEVGDDLERFTCSYCGTAQIVERSGGVVSTRKLEVAIGAVQRGTDRTAAELAMPRLNRELEEAKAEKMAMVQSAQKRIELAKSSRLSVTLITFACVAIGGIFVIGMSDSKGKITSFLQMALWWVGVVVAPFVAYKTFKMPAGNGRVSTKEIDERIARIEGHIQANRRILDAMPS